jgi:acetylornithine deacetylase
MTVETKDKVIGNSPTLDYKEILQNLVGFPTISSDSNLACIDYIDEYLTDKGFNTRRVFNHDQSKANLIAKIGPEIDGGIMLSGHTDIVPVAGQEWQSDPFELLEKDGKLYGRGTTDMKGFIALVMYAVATITPKRLKRPLFLVFTYDEEVGCHGAKSLVEDLKIMDHRPAFVLIGEPTNMELVTAHKGICISRTNIRGKPSHACRPDDGASAISAAVKLISQIDGIIPSDRDETFDPPTATFNIGKVYGGNATNIIAQDCTLEWEFRPLPSQDVTSVQAKFRKLADVVEREMPGVFVNHQVDSIVPGLKEGENRQFATELQSCMEHAKLSTAAFTTEGGLFQEAGIPAIICGPGHITQAHQPNEHITVSMMEQFYKFLVDVIEKFTM